MNNSTFEFVTVLAKVILAVSHESPEFVREIGIIRNEMY